MGYTEKRSIAIKKANQAQQCAECVYSFKGILPEELTLEAIRQRAAEGCLPCMVGMSRPVAGSCPSFQQMAPDGAVDDGCNVDENEYGITTIEVLA